VGENDLSSIAALRNMVGNASYNHARETAHSKNLSDQDWLRAGVGRFHRRRLPWHSRIGRKKPVNVPSVHGFPGFPGFPSWNRYSYVLNNPMSAADPDGLDCVYLNNAGDGVESIDQNSNPEECGSNGGYWVNGGVTSAQINSEAGTVDLTGTTNGVDNNTSSHYQDSGMSSPPLWQGISDWYQHFINDWNRRIDAHRPPPQRPSTLDPLQYINNIMMGAVPVFPSAGSTGRTAPANLKEQLAMEQVKANPGGKRLPLQMNDATLARKPRLGQNE